MGLNAVKILKITVTNSSKKEILEEIQKYLTKNPKNDKKPLIIFTPNTEQLVLADKNSDFRAVLNRADISLPDANGVVWASRILTTNPIAQPIPGVEFIESLTETAQKLHVPVGLIGGYGNVAVNSLECLQKKYPGLVGWGDECTDEEILARKIKERNTKIVFVALGPPKQEYFIEAIARKLNNVVLMSVGGSFDIISGRLPRAPGFMRAIGFEWLWRLILEPWRIFRQLALVEFIWLVLREKLTT